MKYIKHKNSIKYIEYYCVARANWIDRRMSDWCKHNKIKNEVDITKEFH